MRVHSVRQIVEVFGSARDAGLALGVSQQRLNHWRTSNTIPPRYYLAHKKVLKRHGVEAPRHLWRCGHCGSIAAE
jgi:hypothetical protein